MIAAVIPTRYFPPTLTALEAVLRADDVHVVTVVDAGERGPDWSIYGIWNRGVDAARAAGADVILVANDDVVIQPGTAAYMARVLADFPNVGVVYPDVDAGRWCPPSSPELVSTRGTWGTGGMTGFCFAFRADLPVRFDERFRWWYGDDAFEEDVREAGLEVCRLRGIPVWHTPNGSAGRDWDALDPLVVADRQRWSERLREVPQ